MKRQYSFEKMTDEGPSSMPYKSVYSIEAIDEYEAQDKFSALLKKEHKLSDEDLEEELNHWCFKDNY